MVINKRIGVSGFIVTLLMCCALVLLPASVFAEEQAGASVSTGAVSNGSEASTSGSQVASDSGDRAVSEGTSESRGSGEPVSRRMSLTGVEADTSSKGDDTSDKEAESDRVVGGDDTSGNETESDRVVDDNDAIVDEAKSDPVADADAAVSEAGSSAEGEAPAEAEMQEVDAAEQLASGLDSYFSGGSGGTGGYEEEMPRPVILVNGSEVNAIGNQDVFDLRFDEGWVFGEPQWVFITAVAGDEYCWSGYDQANTHWDDETGTAYVAGIDMTAGDGLLPVGEYYFYILAKKDDYRSPPYVLRVFEGKTGEGASYIVTLDENCKTLVAGCDAYINATITGPEDSVGLMAALFDGTTQISDPAVVTGGQVRLHAFVPEDVGEQLRLGLYLEEGTLLSVDTITIKHPQWLWEPWLYRQDGPIQIAFAEPISLAAKAKATINGVPTAIWVEDGRRFLWLNGNLKPGDVLVVSGVKYPELFPSYSFTFTLTM